MAEKKTENKEEKAEKQADVKAEKAEKKETAKKAEKPAPAKKAEKPNKKVEKKAEKEDTKVYHISKRKEDHLWQVKAEGSPRALKTFFTQEEAVEYAKRVAGNNEGRIVIHKVDGSFKKLKY